MKERSRQEQLPEGWRLIRVEDVCELKYGKSLPERFRESGSFLVYGSNGSVGHHSSALTSAPVIIVGRKGSIGEIHYSERPCFPIDTTYFIDEVHPDVLLEWLAITLRASSLPTLNKASGVPGLNREDVYRIEIPLPPLSDQQRIAQVLKTKLATVERVRRVSAARFDAACVLSAAYLREVYESNEAKDWQWSELAEVASLLPSKSIATAGDTKVTAITTACLTERGFDPSGVKTATMHRPDAEIAAVGVGEVLIARSNTPELVGRVSVFRGVPLGAVASDLTIRVWPGDRLDSDFLGYYLSYLFLTGYWQDNAGGASGTMKKITRTQLAGISVPVPDRDTQARVRRRLKSRLAMVDRLATELDLECSGIKALGPALLRQAFCGAL